MTMYLRGEGGAVFPMDPPLCPHIERRFDAGELTRVNADGSLWTGEPVKPRRGRPPGSKNKPKPEPESEAVTDAG